jgi:hypothetical protein
MAFVWACIPHIVGRAESQRRISQLPVAVLLRALESAAETDALVAVSRLCGSGTRDKQCRRDT